MWRPDRITLRRFALEALEGVGDADLGEWEEWTGRAFHVRRRVSAVEQEQVGDAVDIRGTEEARRRIGRVARFARQSPQGVAVMADELQGLTL